MDFEDLVVYSLRLHGGRFASPVEGSLVREQNGNGCTSGLDGSKEAEAMNKQRTRQRCSLRLMMTMLLALSVIVWSQVGVADARGFHGGGRGGFHGGARGGFHGGHGGAHGGFHGGRHGGFGHHGFHGGFGHRSFHGGFGYYGYPSYSYPSYGYPSYGYPTYSYPSYGSCYTYDAYGRCVSYAPNGGYYPY